MAQHPKIVSEQTAAILKIIHLFDNVDFRIRPTITQILFFHLLADFVKNDIGLFQMLVATGFAKGE
jgi:hypothetical protein